MTSAAFEADVTQKIGFQAGDIYKVSSLLHHYKKDLIVEDVSEQTNRDTAYSYIRQLSSHLLFIKDTAKSHHVSNDSSFDELFTEDLELYVIALDPILWLSSKSTYVNGGSVSDDDVVTVISDRTDFSYSILSNLITWDENLANNAGALEMGSDGFHITSSGIDLTTDNTFCCVVKTPSSWSGYHTILNNTNGNRYILYNSGELKNFSHFDTGLTLSLSTIYMITHVVNSSGEEFRVQEQGESEVTASQNNSESRSSDSTLVFGSGANSSALHTWRGSIGEALIINSIDEDDITKVHNYLKNRYNI